ncbi:MAG: DUF2480 family protein [Bacteroidota bacterium]
MSESIINKVTESGIITLNLETYLPAEIITVFDIKDYLFMGLILKEKDFRQSLKELDRNQYQNKIVAVTCSADAIIPLWAYMLISSILQPVANSIIYGNEEEARKKTLIKNIQKINPSEFTDKRVVVKGCGEISIPEEAYFEITNILRPVAKSIMFGEPCSTVPIYKKIN